MKKRSISSVYRSIHLHVLMITCFVFVFNTGLAQKDNVSLINSIPEKVYLQLDNKFYTNDQTIWFKTIVTNSGNHALTKLSKVLYVELISPNEIIMERKLIKLENGIGSGSFRLNKKYVEGSYLIRAYTKWNLNFDPGFIFETYIRVFTVSKKENINPIGNISLVKKEHDKRLLKVSFNPSLTDSLHAKKIEVIVIQGNEKDTFLIKNDRNDKFMLNYEIPDKCNVVNLQVQTDNLFHYSKTIVLDDDNLDLQFFPESGELVHGLKSKVGFKALAPDGTGRIVEGDIVNRQGEVVARFKSNKPGMGSFVLTKADSTQAYAARLKSPSDENRWVEYPLPDVAKKGNILSVVKDTSSITFCC